VPTIIVYEKGKETGRIIETPVISLEKDLLAITSQQSYTPNYKGIAYWQQHVDDRNKLFADDKLNALAINIKTGMLQVCVNSMLMVMCYWHKKISMKR